MTIIETFKEKITSSLKEMGEKTKKKFQEINKSPKEIQEN